MTVEKKESKQGGLGRYLKGVRTELKKVVWPSRNELIKYSALVILLSVIASISIFIFDFIIRFILNLIIG